MGWRHYYVSGPLNVVPYERNIDGKILNVQMLHHIQIIYNNYYKYDSFVIQYDWQQT